MPFPAIVGNRTPLNLGVLHAADTRRLVFNLGVDDGGGTVDPPDPPAPEIIGDTISDFSLRWARGTSFGRASRPRWGALQQVLRQGVIGWGGLVAQQHAVRLPWETGHQVLAGARAGWGYGRNTLARRISVPWASPPQHASAVTVVWSGSMRMTGRTVLSPWRAPPETGAGILSIWSGHLPVRIRAAAIAWAAPPKVLIHWIMPWGRGDGLDWLVLPPKPPVVPPGDLPLDGRWVGLNLGCRVYSGDTRRVPLNLGITACWLGRPQRRSYIVLNEFSIVRLPDRMPIHADAVSIDGGREAWCWSAQMTLADPAQLVELTPTVAGPRQVEITINGYAWVIAIEAFDKQEVFGDTQVSLTGRSVTAQLAEPYAAPRTREVANLRTMQQLADTEVDGSEVSIDYATVSWLVPAGAWYYDSLTPMSALQRLAEGAGAVVQSDPALPVVRFAPRYPVSPWNWTTSEPDVVIQDDVVTGQRLQLQSRPLYDAVIVAGERVGVGAKVRRDGEAGQTFAPQQIDQLITHADGARERGRNVLSDRGGQASIEQDIPLFRTPLLDGQPGLVLPLMLAQRVAAAGTWHGLVTGVRISASRQDKAIDVLQTVTLERHYADAD